MSELDSVNVDNLERNLKNLKDEYRNYKEKVDGLKQIIVFAKRELALQMKLVDIVTNPSSNKRLDPKFEFENTPQYLAFQAELDRLGLEKKMFELQQMILMHDRSIENAQDEIDRIEAEIPRAEKKLNDARGV